METIITKRAAKKRVDKSFIVTIRQGTSKKDVLDLLRYYQVRKYKVTDIKVSNLRPLDNSSPHLLDITFVKCEIGISPDIIEPPLATSTPIQSAGPCCERLMLLPTTVVVLYNVWALARRPTLGPCLGPGPGKSPWHNCNMNCDR